MLSLRSRASSEARTLYVPLELLNARLDTLSIISSISHPRATFLPDSSKTSQRPTKAKLHLSRNNTYNEPITYYRSKTSINLMNHFSGPSRRHVSLQCTNGNPNTWDRRDVIFYAIFRPESFANIINSCLLLLSDVRSCILVRGYFYNQCIQLKTQLCAK